MKDFSEKDLRDEMLDDELDAVASDSVEEGDEMYEHFAVTVDKGQSMMRLDKYLTIRLENTSRNRIQTATYIVRYEAIVCASLVELASAAEWCVVCVPAALR